MYSHAARATGAEAEGGADVFIRRIPREGDDREEEGTEEKYAIYEVKNALLFHILFYFSSFRENFLHLLYIYVCVQKIKTADLASFEGLQSATG